MLQKEVRVYEMEDSLKNKKRTIPDNGLIEEM